MFGGVALPGGASFVSRAVGRHGVARLVTSLVAAMALGLAPMVAFAPAFGGLGDQRYLLPIAGAVAVAAIAGLGLVWARRLGAAARALAALGLLAVYVAVVIAPGPAVVSGPRRLVTSALPLDPLGPELATVAVFCGLATIWAAETALTWRASLLPLAVPLLFTAAGCALSASVAPPPSWLAFAIVLTAVCLAAQPPPRPTTPVDPAESVRPGPIPGTESAASARPGTTPRAESAASARAGTTSRTEPAESARVGTTSRTEPEAAARPGTLSRAETAVAAGEVSGAAAWGPGARREVEAGDEGIQRGLVTGARMVAAVVVALVVVGSVAVTPVVMRWGRGEAFDGRSLFAQPVRPLVQTSPLAQFAAIRSGRLPLSLRIEADAAPQRMRYLSMDRFDGDYWTSVAHYKRAGHRLPAQETQAAGGWEIVEQVTVERPGPLGWLPASGRPEQVSVAGLGVDEETGELALPEGSPIPAAYTIRSRVPIRDEELVASATPASPPRQRSTAVPADLAAKAVQVVGGEFGHPALAQLAAHFAQEGGFTLVDAVQSRSGHGWWHVRQLLELRSGTAEQYASAFAVLARALGYDTRVVVGFVPRPEGSGFRVVGGDIDAWPEVRFTDVGWVPYYPTPGQRSAAETPKPPAPQPEPTPEVTRSALAPPAQEGPAALPGAPGQVRIADAARVSAIAVAVLVLLLAAVPLAKADRRRRRRRGEPNARVLGAWLDTVDRFAEAGLRVPISATPAEVATAAARRFAPALAHDALRLAALHDAAAFGPAPHGPTNAATAWRHATLVRRELRRSLGLVGRLRAALSPRPLLHRRRRPR